MEFKLLKGIKQGSYVEFNISGSESDYAHWDDASLFLDEAVFGLFAERFQACVKDFNYYGPTRYTSSDLSKLREELKANAAGWIQIADPSELSPQCARDVFWATISYPSLSRRLTT